MASRSSRSTTASSQLTYSQMVASGDVAGVEIAIAGASVNLVQLKILALSSGRVMRCSGLGVKIRLKMSLSSSERGKMVLRKPWLRVKARYVESSWDACFHGLRPQVRLTRTTPRLQTSLGAQ